jgi:hypothetical protein
MAPYRPSPNEISAVYNLAASTIQSITASSTSSLQLATRQPVVSVTPLQPDSGPSSSLDTSSIQNITFGTLATVIAVGGLILAYAQVRKSKLSHMILEGMENGME